jgi:hypothetical protein
VVDSEKHFWDLPSRRYDSSGILALWRYAVRLLLGRMELATIGFRQLPPFRAILSVASRSGKVILGKELNL